MKTPPEMRWPHADSTKNMIRVVWLHMAPRRKDVITISHGAIGVLNIASKQVGRILVCELDPKIIRYTMEIKSHFPDLKFLPERLGDIRLVVHEYLALHGRKRLGVVDIDVVETVLDTCEILKEVAKAIHDAKGKGVMIIAYFTNGPVRSAIKNRRFDWMARGYPPYRGADKFKSTEARLKWLAAQVRSYANLKRSTNFDWCDLQMTQAIFSIK